MKFFFPIMCIFTAYLLLQSAAVLAEEHVDSLTINDEEEIAWDFPLDDLDGYHVLIMGSNDFKADTAVSSTKFELPLIYTPQTITVLTEEIIESQQASTLADILKNDASISQVGSFQGIRERFAARGFELNARGNYLRNGRVYWFYDFPPAEILDRVEVIKGPSAIYGQGSPGATINMITKAPTLDPLYDLQAFVGSFNDYRLHADLGGPIGDNDNVAYRANILIKRADSFREHIFNDRAVGSLAFDWYASEHTLLNFYLDVTHDKRPQDSGLFAIGEGVADVSRDKVLNAPWAINDMTTTNFGSAIDHEINSHWRMEAGVNVQDFYRDRTDTSVRRDDDNADNGQYSLQYQRRIDNWRYYTGNIDFINEGRLFDRDNQMVVGASYIRTTFSQKRTDRMDLGEFDIFDPNAGFPDNPNSSLTALPGKNIDDTVGLFVQDVLSLTDRLDLMTGARFDYVTTSPRDSASFSEHKLTPRAGLLYKFTPNFTSYVSYLESFEPNGVVSGDYINEGERLKPTTGQQAEAGLKADVLNNRVALTAAIFNIVRKNQLSTENVDGDDVLLQRGEQTHHGVELGAVGRMTDHWQILASAMYLDAKITNDSDTSLIGNTPHGAPKWSASLWTEYDLQHIPNLSLFAGTFYEGTRQGDDANTFTVPGYNRIDIGLSHETQFSDAKVITRFNIENLFDKTYFYASGRENITVGDPRSFKFAVNVLFN